LAHHDRTVDCVRGLAEGESPWAIPWPCIHECVAVVTNPRIVRDPSPLAEAIEAVDGLLESPPLSLLAEGPGSWAVFARLAREGSAFGSRIHDARITAFCLAYGATELWTADRDFARFPSLRTRNPCLA